MARHPTKRSPARPVLAAALLLLCIAGSAMARDVELYERADFGGTRLTLDGAAPDLAAYGLGTGVSSVVVTRGQWEFCTQPAFGGACITVGPGRYNRLPAALNDRLASLRPVGAAPPQPPQPPQPRPPRDPQRPEPSRSAAIVLFAGPFTGPALPLDGAVANLASMAYNDTANAIEVRAGEWELCSDGGYGGQCLRFGPGRHLLPPALRDRLSSLRPVAGGPAGPTPSGRDGRDDRAGRDDPDRPGVRPWPGATPAIVLYERGDFDGRQLPLAGAADNLRRFGFDNRASSVEVFRGRWQLCRQADFDGGCVVLGPGRYTLDRELQNEVSSARPLFGRDERPLGEGGAVTLHEQLDLRGRSVFVDRRVANLSALRFNDRAVAIEVHAGEWQLCSDANLRGRCASFGPGWHRLPPGLAGALTSLRPR